MTTHAEPLPLAVPAPDSDARSEARSSLVRASETDSGLERFVTAISSQSTTLGIVLATLAWLGVCVFLLALALPMTVLARSTLIFVAAWMIAAGVAYATVRLRAPPTRADATPAD